MVGLPSKRSCSRTSSGTSVLAVSHCRHQVGKRCTRAEIGQWGRSGTDVCRPRSYSGVRTPTSTCSHRHTHMLGLVPIVRAPTSGSPANRQPDRVAALNAPRALTGRPAGCRPRAESSSKGSRPCRRIRTQRTPAFASSTSASGSLGGGTTANCRSASIDEMASRESGPATTRRCSVLGASGCSYLQPTPIGRASHQPDTVRVRTKPCGHTEIGGSRGDQVSVKEGWRDQCPAAVDPNIRVEELPAETRVIANPGDATPVDDQAGRKGNCWE